jgi:hypothetical protein
MSWLTGQRTFPEPALAKAGVDIHYPAVSRCDALLCPRHRLMRAATGTQAEARLGERRVPVRLQRLQHRLLDEAIEHPRDTEGANAPRLWYLHSPNRLRPIGASSSWIFCRTTRSRHPLLLTASNVRAFGQLVPFLLCPLLTPTPRSRTLRYAQSRLRDATQVSRGKFNRLPRAPAGSTVPAPCLRSGKLLMAVDFAVHGPLVRPGRLHIRFLFVGPRVCSTLPLDPASRRRRCALLTLLRHQDG